MESCPDISEIDSYFQNMSNDFVESSFMLGRNHVLRNVEYLERFKKINAWSIGTWNVRIRRNSILKHGTEADKARLGPGTRYNQPHKEKRKFSKAPRALYRTAEINQAILYLANQDE